MNVKVTLVMIMQHALIGLEHSHVLARKALMELASSAIVIYYLLCYCLYLV